jgi:hypothetical protein
MSDLLFTLAIIFTYWCGYAAGNADNPYLFAIFVSSWVIGSILYKIYEA